MTATRRLFSICIPAYNRANHLPTLLDSVFAQDFTDFEIVICEDRSPEREQIAAIVRRYAEAHPGVISYYENEKNLGYDGNFRNLVEKATGEFCFFMGNDDIVCPNAFAIAADLIARNPDAGFVLRAFAWFDDTPNNPTLAINQEVRYFTEERRFAAGREAILLCYRRSGVISGYIVRRDPAYAAATDRYDGTLYYQMHLTLQVLATYPAVFTPEVLVLVRSGEPPQFGNSGSEKGKFVPGLYTPQARLNMVGGALRIIRDFDAATGLRVSQPVQSDYANYFFPYIRDQLKLPFRSFWFLYRGYGRMGFDQYPIFHFYCLVAFAFGEKNFDRVTKKIRSLLGRSPHFGKVGK